MGEFVISAGTVLAAFAIHLVAWRVRVPERQTRAVLAIFFGTLATALLLLPVLAASWPALRIPVPVPMPSYLSISGFVTAVTLAYMITYSAVEVDSPSLVMVLAIDRAGPGGLPESEFDQGMSDALLVEPRIRDLLRDGLIREEDGLYRLTPKGVRMARLFIRHRWLLGAGKGG